ncbi:SLATT domain-containing protein [Nonomuraea maritima]|uniref:SLATT domain-containing protein n=1 Tax=Nonomuraea maritima TaxID=683260 RepID=UPI00115FE2A2|nr:SLATT domain-containing protein [Nonomuraea maritima]
MPLDASIVEPYVRELEELYVDSTYSAMTYFEAAKSAELLGKVLVFVPALISSMSGLLVALGQTGRWGAVSALAGAVAATAAFLGSDRKAPSFKDSARQFTVLRHRAKMESNFALSRSSTVDLEAIVRELRGEYENIVSKSEPTPNRVFVRAQKRISSGATSYEVRQDPNSAP